MAKLATTTSLALHAHDYAALPACVHNGFVALQRGADKLPTAPLQRFCAGRNDFALLFWLTGYAPAARLNTEQQPYYLGAAHHDTDPLLELRHITERPPATRNIVVDARVLIMYRSATMPYLNRAAPRPMPALALDGSRMSPPLDSSAYRYAGIYRGAFGLLSYASRGGCSCL